jgi:hypothetical protein
MARWRVDYRDVKDKYLGTVSTRRRADPRHQAVGGYAMCSQSVYSGPSERMSGLRHMQTLIGTPDRLYVAADNTVYAFAF